MKDINAESSFKLDLGVYFK